MEKFDPMSPEGNQEDLRRKLHFEVMSSMLDKAEAVFAAEGRDATKPLLNGLYANLIDLNKTKGEVYPLKEWNKDSDLSEQHFNELNLRRKKLSNAVGIMTASGVVRHDLNEI